MQQLLKGKPLTPKNSKLAGTRVVITRPAHLAERFNELVTASGGQAISLPAIDIVPVDRGYASELLPGANTRHTVAIFISRNAVEHGRKLVSQLPADTRCLAIGSRTASELEQAGIPVAFHPQQGFTSEDLLAWPELQALDDTRVFIFCGEGGRPHLADELTRRGAEVTRLEVYRRSTPQMTRTELAAKLLDTQPNVVTITSVETLRNFLLMADKLPDFDARALALIAGSGRIAEAAVAAGFKQDPWIAADPSDASMFKALLEWRQNEILHYEQG